MAVCACVRTHAYGIVDRTREYSKDDSLGIQSLASPGGGEVVVVVVVVAAGTIDMDSETRVCVCVGKRENRSE